MNSFCNANTIVLTKNNWKEGANIVNAGLSVMNDTLHPYDQMSEAFCILTSRGFVRETKPWAVSCATVVFSRGKDGASEVRMQVVLSFQARLTYATVFVTVVLALKIKHALFDFPIRCIKMILRRG